MSTISLAILQLEKMFAGVCSCAILRAGRGAALRLSMVNASRPLGSVAARQAPKVHIKMFDEEGVGHDIVANEGETVLDVAQANDIELEGACEGTLACSTCHVIIDKAHFEQLPEPLDDELDMLDQAVGLQETSRLGCQIRLNSSLDGMTCALPANINDM